MSATAQLDTVERIFDQPNILANYNHVLITPELAERFLALNHKNRKLRPNRVAELADAMRKGEWQFFGQAIVISKEGSLLDGQHRLAAIIKSKKPQMFNVQTGVEESAFKVIDTNKVRSAIDVAYIDGVTTNTSVIVAAVKIINAYYALINRRTSSLKIENPRSFKLSHTQTLKLLNTYKRERLEEFSKFASLWFKQGKFLSKSTYLAFMYIFSQQDERDAIIFFNMLAGGENIGKDSFPVIYNLRERFRTDYMEKVGYFDVRHKWTLLIKAWNAFRDKKNISSVKLVEGEAFPEAI
jgi:predicted ester cyclase